MKFSSVPLIKIEQSQNESRSHLIPQLTAIESSSFSHLVTSPPLDRLTLLHTISISSPLTTITFYIFTSLMIEQHIVFQPEPYIFPQPFRIEIYFRNKNLFLRLHGYQLPNELNLEQWVSIKQLNRAHKPIAVSSLCAPCPIAQRILWNSERMKKLYTDWSGQTDQRLWN